MMMFTKVNFEGPPVPNNLREIRRKKRISLERLASLTGYSHTTWSRIERGTAEMLAHHLDQAATALRVSPFEIDPDAHISLSTDQREVLDLLDKVPESERDAVLVLLRKFAS